MVTLGCPHLSLEQVREIAQMVEGKTIKPGVRMWLQTNAFVKGMARQLGYAQTIEKFGGILTQDCCTNLSYPELIGVKTMASNTAKVAFYTHGSNGINIWCGSTEKCVQAAIDGYWSE